MLKGKVSVMKNQNLRNRWSMLLHGFGLIDGNNKISEQE
tara:strand:- start:2877 stop:2993 length:117 start_codon:yes stop_codon:yes gene_type:complete